MSGYLIFQEFPVAGGQWGKGSCSYTEMLITGHVDGSVKFWDISASTYYHFSVSVHSKDLIPDKSVSKIVTREI